MLCTEDSCEKVACNAVVDFVISHRVNELFVSPYSSVLTVTVPNSLGWLCDVGRTKRWVTSPPRSSGSRLTNNEEDNLTGVSSGQIIANDGLTLILTKVDCDSVV